MGSKTNQHATRTFTLIPFKPRSCKKNTARPTRRLFLIDIENYCGKTPSRARMFATPS